jgi:hypothetical protein
MENLTIDLSGLVVDPIDKPVPNLWLAFSTNPPTITSTVITNAQGIWSVNDALIIPEKIYVVTLAYKNSLNTSIV